MREFVRRDYSTIHVIDFDLQSGDIFRMITAQGHSDTSCWSRGQAWATYGFTLAYQTSQERRFLDVARGLADYSIENLPDDLVPYWDFSDPRIPDSVRDSSAAAIACSGLLTLSGLSGERRFGKVAANILNSLVTNYLTEDSDGMLRHSCFHKAANFGVDESLIWGGYYCVEALAKVLRRVR